MANTSCWQDRVPGYLQAIDRHFEAHRNHEAVQLARELSKADGVSFDAVMSTAGHIKDVETLAERIGELMRRYDESRPKVAAMNITNSAQDVDPNLTEIVIRFDRPMRKTSYAVTRTNAARYPKISKVRFDETGTVFTIPVTLEPDHDYEFSLNWPGGGSFAGAEGVPLKPVPISFRTKAGASPSMQP